jgi:Swi5-dependent recombination DNA repair protein 1
MSTPAAKRRRIEVAASTLSKPFRSPFKSPLKGQSSSHNSNRPIIPTAPETSPFTFSKGTSNLPVCPPAGLDYTLGPSKKSLSPSAFITAQLNTDPEIARLLCTQRELEKQLRQIKEQLETAEQARKIESESRKTATNSEIDGELVILIQKWKGASRQAAEELFGKVRDRVNRWVYYTLITLVEI